MRAYSQFKRGFGEYMSARKFVKVAKGMATESYIYNLFVVSGWGSHGSGNRRTEPRIYGTHIGLYSWVNMGGVVG
ncbi:MAG: hypothetical protein QXP58_05250 [Thermoprotei archaeon]